MITGEESEILISSGLETVEGLSLDFSVGWLHDLPSVSLFFCGKILILFGLKTVHCLSDLVLFILTDLYNSLHKLAEI